MHVTEEATYVIRLSARDAAVLMNILNTIEVTDATAAGDEAETLAGELFESLSAIGAEADLSPLVITLHHEVC
jgi:hypothetical protein